MPTAEIRYAHQNLDKWPAQPRFLGVFEILSWVTVALPDSLMVMVYCNVQY